MTALPHVLIVDDEPLLLRTLALNLAGRGYRVSTAATGASALESADTLAPGLIVLDLGLPDIDGQSVLRQLRARSDPVPVLVLSARHGSADKIAALDEGANDYVTKPFDMNELAARLRAMSRGPTAARTLRVVHLGDVHVDLADRLVRREGEDTVIRLTPTEWRMLETLLTRPGMLVTPAQLLTAMRGDPAHTERSYLRIYVQQLRRKLEHDAARPRFLLTETGLGYRYQP